MSASFSAYLVAMSTTGGKFWEVEVVESEVRTRYGKLGADPKWSSKACASPEEARRSAAQQVGEKSRKGYSEAPRPRQVSQEALTLAAVPLTGVFYFRALDRCPGGNADMFTLKLTLDLVPGQAPALKAKAHHNWDGQHTVYPEAPVNLPGLAESVPTLLRAAQALIDKGTREVAASIIEPRVDREHYDTEWSSLEFSLYARGAPPAGTLVLHVLQKAVPRGATPPDALAGAFIDAVHAAMGIGRVEQYSDCEDAFSKAHKPAMQGKPAKHQSGEVPLYL